MGLTTENAQIKKVKTHEIALKQAK